MRSRIPAFFIVAIVLISGCISSTGPNVNMECSIDNNMVSANGGSTFFRITINNQEPLKQDISIAFTKNPRLKVTDGVNEKQNDIITVAPNSRAQRAYTITASLDQGTSTTTYRLKADGYVDAKQVGSCTEDIEVK